MREAVCQAIRGIRLQSVGDLTAAANVRRQRMRKESRNGFLVCSQIGSLQLWLSLSSDRSLPRRFRVDGTEETGWGGVESQNGDL
jgi:hypothetical protein